MDLVISFFFMIHIIHATHAIFQWKGGGGVVVGISKVIFFLQVSVLF